MLAEASRFEYNELLDLRASNEESNGIVWRIAKAEFGEA